MSRRKGLSLEEKRQKMLELFYEKKDFYQLKELEKLGPKEKGVISQSVKEVVTSLVDDGLVDTDKIGTCVYFWAFPSKAETTRKRKLEDVEVRLKTAKKRLTASQIKMKETQIGREDNSDRTEALNRLGELEESHCQLTEKIQKYKDSDPDVLQKIVEETEVAREAVNRWTDNIEAVKSWCRTKFFIEEDTLNKQFGIPAEFDYV
ncbi:meiotic nuclear division protein 1 homolog [Oratosquilla oratoria]|uniref:meiotic nuclear division protein 1 homolog n=1 Tax=Oratosquilla oratoria TaxID=337810 RepID=UPI003F75AEC4